MTSRTSRETFSRLNALYSRTPAWLAGRAGRARTTHTIELLESRAMLAGDHPNLPTTPTPWTATALTLDLVSPTGSPDFGRGSRSGVIGVGDPGDLFTFTMPTVLQGGKARDFVTVLADTTSVSGSTLDSMVEVYNSAGQLITVGQSNGGVSIGVTTNPTLPKAPDGWAGFEGVAGQTYYIRVRADTSIGTGRTNSGGYLLRLDTITVPIAIDTISTNTGVFGTGRETTNISFAQDDVVYAITTPNDPRFDGLSSLQATSLDVTTPQVNPHLDLYSAGNGQGVVTPLVGDQDSGRQTDAFTVYRTARNTTYYLRVRSDDYRPTSTPGSGTIGAFTAFVRMAAPEIVVDPVTRLGQTGAEQVVGPDLSTGAPLDGAGMRLFKFTAQGTGQGIITVIGGGLIPNADGVVNPAVRLYDVNGLSIDFNKALASTAQIQTPLVGGQTYYLVAEGFDSTADLTNNTRDGNVRIFVEAHHTFNPTTGQEVDDHIDNPNVAGVGAIPLWEDATPIRFGAPTQINDTWSQAGQDPAVTTNRQDHSFIQTGIARGRINRPGDTDIFQFTPPLSQLSDYAGDFTRNTPSLFVGGNYATAGLDSVDGTAAKRNNISVWDLGNWFDTGPRDMRDAGNNLLDGPIDGPIRTQKVWDPDGAGPLLPVLAVAGEFTRVWSLVPNAAGVLENRVVNATVAFRTFYAPENRYIWSTSIGYRLLPGQGRYTTITNPVNITGPILASEAFDAEPNVQGQTGAGPDELILGGNFRGNFNPADPMEQFNSLAQLQFRPTPGFTDRGTLTVTSMGGGVLDTGGTAQGVVRAFAVYDPANPTAPTNPAPMPVPTPAQPDAPQSLIIGGLFARADQPDGITPGQLTATNIVRYGKRIQGDNNPNLYMPLFNNFALINGPANNNPATSDPAPLQPGQTVPATATEGVTATGGANGGVYSLAVMDAPGLEFTPAAPWGPNQPTGQDIPVRLYIGGAFTRNVLSPTVANGESVSNLVSYDGNNYYPVSNVNPQGGPPSVPAGSGQFTGIVRSLTVWRRTQNLRTTGTDPVLVVAADATPLPGGSLFANSGIVRQWAGQAQQAMTWSTLATTPDGTVLTTAVVEENEPATSAPYEQLYIGGTFTQITANGVTTPNLNRVARFATYSPQAQQWNLTWSGLTGGVTGLSDPPPTTQTITAVYSLGLFQDQPAGEVRRNSRPGSRAQIRVEREDDSQETINLQVRVFDSNFALIYQNDSVAAGAADPAGANNPAFGFTNFIMPETWAGEAYYIEVSGGGTGRYRLSLTTEALPPKDQNVSTDGVYQDTYSIINKPVGAGRFVDAPLIPIDGFGYGRNYSIEPNGPLATGRVPRPGDPMAPFDPNFPDAYTQRRYVPDVNGYVRYINEDPATISVPNETHIYQFRAPNDGAVELRLATKQIQAGWSEQVIDELNEARPFAMTSGAGGNPNRKVKTFNSPLHGAIRVFTNDRSTGQFVQTGFANDNVGIGGFADVIPYRGGGAFNPADVNQRVFTHDDPRLVIPVQRGNTYFVQVESAFKGVFESDPNLVDWRFATGAYELTVRATNSLNGIDDYENANPDLFGNLPSLLDDTSLIVDTRTGQGSLNGEIRNVTTGPFQNPVDTDTFRWYATNRGQVRVTITPTSPLLTPRLEVVAGDGSRPATGAAAGPNQAVTVTFSVEQGQALFFIVSGANNTQGTYRLNIQAIGLSDDQAFSDATDTNNLAPVAGWANARQLTLNRFLGSFGVPNPTTGTIQDASGTIENPDDRDIFKFTAEAYELATVTVTRTDITLDPLVQVFERSVDGQGFEVFLLIAQNDDGDGVAPNARTIFSTTPGREYYVVVQGASPVTDFGRYNLRINVAPTDDHPNRSDFPSGSLINLAFDSINFTSSGSTIGRIERSSDEDLFRFVAPADGTANITASRRNASTLKIGLTVLDSSNQGFPGGRVTYSFGSNGTISVRLTGLVANTQYYILITPDVPGAGETQTGDYTVSVNTEPVDDYPNAGQFSIAQNVPLSSGTNSGTISGVLVPTGDSDLFRFTTLVTGTATIRITTPSSSLNPRVVIFNAGQTQTQALDGNGDSATIGFSVTAGDVYYVLVLASTTASGVTAVGPYTVTITNVASGGGGGGGGGGPDDFPNAGEWNDAFNVGLDSRTGRGSLNGVINFSGDTDLFRFTPASSGAVDIQLNIPRGGSVDGQLEVYDSNRVLLFTDALGIAGATAAISFNATGAQQYFVLVRPSGPATGSYTLRIASIPLTSVVFYPEGFAGGGVNEFVPIVNPNSFPVTYQLYARYETGANPDVPIATGTIPANSRGGVATITNGNLSGALVRTGVGYALELRSSAPVGATLSHFDFSASIGESFTDLTSTTWTFAEVHKDRNNWRDFLLFYNPGNTNANLTIEAFYTDGFTTSFTASLESLRRGGINIEDEGRLSRQGVFGVRVTSDVPIVSALTSYNLPRAGGDGLLGDSGGGATRGVMPGIRSGAGTVSNFTFLNANNAPATVSLVASYARLDLPAVTRTITIPARSAFTATYDSIGLIAGQNVGVSYSSDVAVTMSSFQFQDGDGDTTTTATSAAKTLLFSDVVIDPTLAGVQYKQRLSFFNPTAQAIDVATTLLFSDGTTAAISVRVEANNYAFLQLDQQPAVLSRSGLATFGLKLDSSQPFVASLLSYNLLLGGGWSQQGQPLGLTSLLSNLA